MTCTTIRKQLAGDSPGRSTELTYYRVGPDDAV